MNANQDPLDDEITQALQMWDASATHGVNDSVRAQLMRRVRRSHNHATVRPRIVWVAASLFALVVGFGGYSWRVRSQHGNHAVALAKPDHGRPKTLDSNKETEEFKKEAMQDLDSLRVKAVLLDQRLRLAELQSELDREQDSFHRLVRAYDRRTRIDHVILASSTEASGTAKP